MFDLNQYKETVQNFDEASGEEVLELLFVFSGVMIIILIAPAVYFMTNNILVAGLAVAFGLMDFVMSQFLPERVETEEEDDTEGAE